jgi:hypothetical protein
MDPNGGVVIFPSDDAFKNWFITEFPKATREILSPTEVD